MLTSKLKHMLYLLALLSFAPLTQAQTDTGTHVGFNFAGFGQNMKEKSSKVFHQKMLRLMEHALNKLEQDNNWDQLEKGLETALDLCKQRKVCPVIAPLKYLKFATDAESHLSAYQTTLLRPVSRHCGLTGGIQGAIQMEALEIANPPCTRLIRMYKKMGFFNSGSILDPAGTLIR